MNNHSLFNKLCPRAGSHWRLLPVIGPLLERFTGWLDRQSYTHLTIRHRLGFLPDLSRWLQRRRRVRSLADLNHQHLNAAHDSLRRRQPQIGQVVRSFQRFLQELRLIPQAEVDPPSTSERELAIFAVHLREVRGLAESTIQGHQGRLRPFLRFVRLDRQAAVLARLKPEQIEAFLVQAARGHNRFTLQQIVASLRAFLRFVHMQGRLTRPLHRQIDTPRVYRQEHLPRAWSWGQVRTLLQSIKRSEASGLRDRALLYLAAAYGLRSTELVHLQLEDLDWRHSILCVRQDKTHHTLRLPLSNEAGDLLLDYLQRGRPVTERREVFLRLRAPRGPLRPAAVYHIFEHRLRDSGLKLSRTGPHVLRHSFAVHLLRQGVPMKAIGDLLGHRHAESTLTYLRLSVDDLRQVGLDVPHATRPIKLLAPGWETRLLPVRCSRAGHRRRSCTFQSGFSTQLQRYLAIKRALGRAYTAEARILRDWDALLYCRQGRAAKVDQKLFDQWRTTLKHLCSREQKRRLTIVRNFLLFDARRRPADFLPDPATFPHENPPRPPRLVTEAEMARVLATTAHLPPQPNQPLRPATARLAFVLLFCCGLRRGELLRLKLQNVELAPGLLRIEATKFHKSRLVPLSPSVTRELRDYLEQRHQHRWAILSGDPLICSGGPPAQPTAYTGTGLARIWQHLCLTVGVLDDRGRPPRLHDLRHSFAVGALQRWYAQDANVQARLPLLATYLGHVSPASTHYYLQWTPALREATSRRFHQGFGPLLPPKGDL